MTMHIILRRAVTSATLMATLGTASVAPAVEVLLSGFETGLETTIPGVTWEAVDPIVTVTPPPGGIFPTEGSNVLQVEHAEVWMANPYLQAYGPDLARAVSESTSFKLDMYVAPDYAWRQVFVIMHSDALAWSGDIGSQLQFDYPGPAETPFTLEYDLTRSVEDRAGNVRPLTDIIADSFDGVPFIDSGGNSFDDFFGIVIAFQGQDNVPLGSSLTYIDNIRLEQPDDVGLAGDYNGDSVVNAADYVAWRNAFEGGGSLMNEGDNPGTVDQGDYNFWVSQFGSTGGSGAASAIPEPSAILLVIIGGAAFLAGRRKENRVRNRMALTIT